MVHHPYHGKTSVEQVFGLFEHKKFKELLESNQVLERQREE
jgi:hypothetical protein